MPLSRCCLVFSWPTDARRAVQKPLVAWLLLALPDEVRTNIFITLFWHVWKARNAKIFEQRILSPHEVLRRVLQDMEDWAPRFRRTSSHVSEWRDFIASGC